MPTVRKQIGFWGTEEYRKRLKREAVDRGVTVQTILEEAVDLYLTRDDGSIEIAQVKHSHDPSDPTLAPEPGHEADTVRALLRMLRSDTPPDFKRILDCILGPWMKGKPSRSKPEAERKSA